MAKKARQRISYILEPPNSSPGGHRLGVNGLAIDTEKSILYSGGRDGIVCAWDLNLDLRHGGRSSSGAPNGAAKAKDTTRFRAQTLAHTHWINDIALAQRHTAVVSASSDLTVKVWRPLEASTSEPVTIGQHADYVKCVATPAPGLEDWVASGGLDRKIYLWDLSGKGKRLEIDVKGEEITEKGSVYALTVNSNILACGGPESTVRLYDAKTGKRITKFVGHTDNVRAILMNEAGDTVITASSDQTVKVWSVTAGRCMHTLTMHNDSVWSLYSDDPELGVFYSSDRSGLVVKTDVRGTLGEWDDGLCLAVAHETDGVSKVIARAGHIWTATSSSSINRWADVDTGPGLKLPDGLQQHRASIVDNMPKEEANGAPTINGHAKKEIPLKAILRISNTASFPAVPEPGADSLAPSAASMVRKDSEILAEAPVHGAEPVHLLPEETIEGQFGLVKHRLLNDRRRVLTLDTSGDVLLWDLIQCKPVRSFGKRHLEDVEPEINTTEAVAPWCSIDISSGNLTVVLEPFNCFDAEMYADELSAEEAADFRDDQRINLGKWILRYLFAKLIDEEIKRDEAYRQKLNEGVEKRIATARANPPPAITIPPVNMTGWATGDSSVTTPKANGSQYPPMTPGIGVASPGPLPSLPEGPVSPGSLQDKRQSQVGRPSAEKDDYFSNAIASVEPPPKPGVAQPEANAEAAKTPVENGKAKEKEKDKDKDAGKSPTTPSTKKSKWPFGSKKLGRSASSSQPEKPAVVEEKAEESEASSSHEKEVDDSFFGVIQKIHNEYDKQLTEHPDKVVETGITPSLPNDTPTLKLPAGTKVIIQEETSGGSAEVYRGTVETVGADADAIEQAAPMWLGDVLLQNTVPLKDLVKVSFVLYPGQDSLPAMPSAENNNNRLNANRMLRVKKILSYVAERIDPTADPENADPEALKPEEYLELYCNDQLLPISMTLATLRAHIWKGGNDVVLHYKANGRKVIPLPKVEEPAAETEPAPAAAQATEVAPTAA